MRRIRKMNPLADIMEMAGIADMDSHGVFVEKNKDMITYTTENIKRGNEVSGFLIFCVKKAATPIRKKDICQGPRSYNSF